MAARPEILAYRPAPIQVGYLGYTSTMRAEFIDHIIVDRFAVPQATTVFCRAAGTNKLFLGLAALPFIAGTPSVGALKPD
jgi:hypothetical protein